MKKKLISHIISIFSYRLSSDDAEINKNDCYQTRWQIFLYDCHKSLLAVRF